MKVNIFLNEKFIKNRYIKESISDYKKRCSKFVIVNLLYKLDLDLFLESTSYNINVTEKGRYVDSISFSEIINNCSLNRFKNINVVFDYKNLNLKDDICFCNIDILSSGFLYVMVLEQVYRSYKIINNEPYHK